jgi:hypothetical protein
MIDGKNCKNSIIPRDYEKIERTVVDLYKSLNIRSVPINPYDVAVKCGYKLVPFSSLKAEAREFLRTREISGASIKKENVFNIYYDNAQMERRQRFTIMHEIGRIKLGHKEDSVYAEKCANHFASYALAPSSLIMKFGCEDFIDVAEKFHVSDECAILAFDRYQRWANFSYGIRPYETNLNNMVDF